MKIYKVKMPPLPQLPKKSATDLQTTKQHGWEEAAQQGVEDLKQRVPVPEPGTGPEGIAIKSEDPLSFMPPGIQPVSTEQKSRSIASSPLPAPLQQHDGTKEPEARRSGGSLSAVGSLVGSSPPGSGMWLGHLIPSAKLMDCEDGPYKAFLVRLTDRRQKPTAAAAGASLNHGKANWGNQRTRLVLRSCRTCLLDDMAAQIDEEIFKAAVIHGWVSGGRSSLEPRL